MSGTSLDKLTIRGFKSIRELEDLELHNLNLFIGANGAGKSNLISFFKLLRSLINGTLNDYISDSGGISDLLYNGRTHTAKMFFSTRFGCRGYRFSIKPGPRENGLLTNEARYYESPQTSPRWWELGSNHTSESLLIDEVNDSSRSSYSLPVYQAINSWKIYHFHDTGSKAPMRHAEILQDNEVLRSSASNIAPFLLKLRNAHPSTYADILNACKIVIPYLDDFILKPEEFGQATKVALSWKSKGSDYPMQPYHFSDGSIRFICLASALLQPTPPSTLIIDEPELGLHPEAICLLAELISAAAKRTQLIISTQSALLISQFDIEDVVIVRRNDGQSSFGASKKKILTNG